MADTRKYDLLELREARLKAKTCYEKERFEKIIDKVMRESGAVRKRREELIKAVRGDDIRAIKRINHELTMMKADDTYGHRY